MNSNVRMGSSPISSTKQETLEILSPVLFLTSCNTLIFLQIYQKLLNIFNLDDKLLSKIIDYQSKKSLEKEKGLDIYIDQILTEKANKK